MRVACIALALLCSAAAPALAQTTPGLEQLYERYPVDPRAATSPEPGPAAAAAAEPSRGGRLGGLSPSAVAGLSAAALALVVLGVGLTRRRRDRLSPRRNETFTPLRKRMARVSPVENAPTSIDLSTASEEQLCRLSGVGPALARRIITWRADQGGFTSVDQLAKVKGIGQARMETLRPYVRAQAPPAAGPVIPAPVRNEPPAPRPTRDADEPRGRIAAGLAQGDRLKIALIGLAVASQVLVVALVVWVL